MAVRQRRQNKQGGDTNEKVETAAGGAKAVGFGLSKIFQLFALLATIALVIGYVRSPLRPRDLSHLNSHPTASGKFEARKHIFAEKRIELPGPECVVEDEEGNLYTGLQNGRIMKIPRGEDGVIGGGDPEVFFTSTFPPHQPATVSHPENGRPLGMRIRDGQLYVIDAVYGLYRIDLTSKRAEFLVTPHDVTPHLKLPDDFDVTSDGSVIFFTDADQNYSLRDTIYAVLEGKCTGRLLRYDVIKKEVTVMKSELCFGNGVQLSGDGATLVVAETLERRVNFIDVEGGALISTLDLPAFPDNVRLNRRGNFYVATSGVANAAGKFANSSPTLRRIVAGIFSQEQLAKLADLRHSIVVECDARGNVIDTFHDVTGQVYPALAHCADLSDGRSALGTYAGHHLVITSPLN